MALRVGGCWGESGMGWSYAGETQSCSSHQVVRCPKTNRSAARAQHYPGHMHAMRTYFFLFICGARKDRMRRGAGLKSMTSNAAAHCSEQLLCS